MTILSCYNTSSGSIIDNNLYPALTINSNNYIGLGSRYPKNRLTLQGLSNNISGPHILAYTDDNSNYPLFQAVQ